MALLCRLASMSEPPKVRLVTFTRAATNELAEAMSAEPALQALRPSTIHLFATLPHLKSGLGELPASASTCGQMGATGDRPPYSRSPRRCDAERGRYPGRPTRGQLAGLKPQQEVHVSEATRSRFLGSWEEHRGVYGYTMLDELPNLLREALRDHDDLVGLNYALLIVDEYQDLNPCDLDVVRRLADRGCAILAAGDDESPSTRSGKPRRRGSGASRRTTRIPWCIP